MYQLKTILTFKGESPPTQVKVSIPTKRKMVMMRSANRGMMT